MSRKTYISNSIFYCFTYIKHRLYYILRLKITSDNPTLGMCEKKLLTHHTTLYYKPTQAKMHQ